MTKHQKQAHDSNTKRPCLQWRPLNDMFTADKRKKINKTPAWRPLDEVLQSGTLLQQQLNANNNVTTLLDPCFESRQTHEMAPASPVPSEQSAVTMDEEIMYSPNTEYYQLQPVEPPVPSSPLVIDHWYSSSPYNNHHQQTTHHHQWISSVCKERPYYPPITAEDANTPIFLNYPPFDLI
jgi:hypothetical protein